MRKRRQWVVALVLVLLIQPLVGQAEDYTYETNNGAIIITGYTGPGGDVTIPDRLPDASGLPVTTIGTNAFHYSSSLTSITLGPNVTSIGVASFASCMSLTNVMIGANVTHIGYEAFYHCRSLSSLTLGPNVTTISPRAFNYCSSLTTVIIPDKVSSIGYEAFLYCSSLTNATLGKSLVSIGYSAFSGTTLSSITIPQSVTSIGTNVFAGSESLNAITVDAANSTYSSLDGVLFNKSQTTIVAYPGGKVGGYVVPNGVTAIADWAFSACYSLTSVIIPGTVTNIRSLAFSYCSGLTNVLISNGLTSIELAAFSACFRLPSLTIPDSVTLISEYAFEGCASLTSLMIGKSVTNILLSAFDHCTSLTEIIVDPLNSFYSSVDGVLFNNGQTTLLYWPSGKAGNCTVPNGVTTIADWAFSQGYSLVNATIPNTLTNIRPFAFWQCYRLTGVYFHGNAPSVSSTAFTHAHNATIYYLPGTTNWSATFGGRPTALWQPQMLTSEVVTSQFGFNIAWSSGMKVAVDTCTDLTNPAWTPLETNTLPADTFYYSDPSWTNSPRRYYRVRWP